MKNSDFIKMTQCNIFSIKFPVDNVKEVLENAQIEIGDTFTSVELVKNPMTGEKVQQLENGLFFTLRTTFKKFTREVLAAKVYELKQNRNNGEMLPSSEKEWEEVAKIKLYKHLPFSSEFLNVFYSPEKEILFTSGNSKHNRLALHHLIKLFELTGFRGVVVSDEKLGLNAKLTAYLEDNKPLFKYLNFQHEATLRKLAGDDEEFLTCRHLDTKAGKEKALSALNNDFRVQSMAMRYEDDQFAVNFKLDSRLKIRSMRFVEYADIARQLNSPKFAGKSFALTEYLNAQLDALLKIASCTVLEFTGETKLEQFV
ncbi:hypothetical protein ACWIUA_12065 [Ursidibacter sp. B-7004-1]